MHLKEVAGLSVASFFVVDVWGGMHLLVRQCALVKIQRFFSTAHKCLKIWPLSEWKQAHST